MRNIIIALAIGLFIGFGSQAAIGETAAKPQQDVHQQRMALMEERDAILLETIQLLKETAATKEAKAKADALEKRAQANIAKHKEMHQMMMGTMGGHGKMDHNHPMMGGEGKKPCCMDKMPCPADKPCPMTPEAPAPKGK